jgi:hypothetical protein
MPRHQPPPPPPIAWDDPPRVLVTKGLLAADLCLSRGAISQYLAQGMPQGPGGMLDYTSAVAWMLANLDATKARRTRAEASSMRRFLNSQADIYATARAGIEAGAAAAYAAALAAGLPEEAAAHLADDAAARAVVAINRRLADDGNEPLPVPPPDLWKRHQPGSELSNDQDTMPA